MSQTAAPLGSTTATHSVHLHPPWVASFRFVRELWLDGWLACGALFALGLGLRLWMIGDRSFWQDELGTVAATMSGLGDFLQAVTYESNMLLYYLGLFVWMRIVGPEADEATIRALSAALGAAAVPLVYLLGRALHSRMAGAAAAVLLAVNSYHVLLSQETRAYGALSCLSVLSFLMLHLALVRGRRRDWLLHGLAGTLALYCHIFAVFAIFAQGIVVLSRRSRAAIRGLLLSCVLMALLLIPLAALVSRQSFERISWIAAPSLQRLLQLFMDFGGGTNGTLAASLVLAVVGVTFSRSGRCPSEYRNWFLLAWLLGPVGLTFGLSFIRPIFHDRYLLTALPALPLLAGVGLACLPRPVGVVALILLAGTSLTTLKEDLTWRWTEPWSELVSYATRQAAPDDGWVFVEKQAQHAFEYYAGWKWGRNPMAPYAHVMAPFEWPKMNTIYRYRLQVSVAELERFAPDHPRIWVVVSHDLDPLSGDHAATPLRRWLVRNGYSIMVDRRFGSLWLLRFSRGT